MAKVNSCVFFYYIFYYYLAKLRGPDFPEFVVYRLNKIKERTLCVDCGRTVTRLQVVLGAEFMKWTKNEGERVEKVIEVFLLRVGTDGGTASE